VSSAIVESPDVPDNLAWSLDKAVVKL
jgi:hypothetical protein